MAYNNYSYTVWLPSNSC